MKNIMFLFVALLFSTAGIANPKPCSSEESCLKDPNCECWCSQKCGFRKKEKGDHPVYIKNDPNGKYCYCKQWDVDHYEENCVQGKDVKQPPNAK